VVSREKPNKNAAKMTPVRLRDAWNSAGTCAEMGLAGERAQASSSEAEFRKIQFFIRGFGMRG
jgi:hypothetical protein